MHTTAGDEPATADRKLVDAPSARLRARLAANKPFLLLMILVLALACADVAWLAVYRHGGAMDIDEAGYLSMSLSDYEALQHGGLAGFVSTVDAQPTQAPLVPALSALVYLVRGRPTFLGAFAVQLLAYLIVIVTIYSIGSLLADRWVGLVAALAVASLPLMIHFIHEYSFAVPAAAAVTVAIWAALRSDWMRGKRYAIVWGIALGAMLIARTMTIAFVPAFAFLAAMHVIGSPQGKRSIIGVACGLGAAALVAGPWYSAQGYSVWQYLTSYGYGAVSNQYGGARSLLSPVSWLTTSQGDLNEYFWLALTLVLIAGAVALIAKLVGLLLRHRLPTARTMIASPWFYLAVVVTEGLLAMQSSRNAGSAFPAPIAPAMLVLAVAGLATVGAKRQWYACAALGVVAVLCLPSLVTATAFNTAAGQPVVVDLPFVMPFNLVDARDHNILLASATGELDPADLRGTKWRRANDALLAAIDSIGGVPPSMPVVFSFAHSMVNTNTLQWEERMTHGVTPAIYLLNVASNGAASYAAQLNTILASGHGIVLVCSDPVGMFPPVPDQPAIRGVLATSGFTLTRTVPLPDGADIEVWSR